MATLSPLGSAITTAQKRKQQGYLPKAPTIQRAPIQRAGPARSLMAAAPRPVEHAGSLATPPIEHAGSVSTPAWNPPPGQPPATTPAVANKSATAQLAGAPPPTVPNLDALMATDPRWTSQVGGISAPTIANLIARYGYVPTYGTDPTTGQSTDKFGNPVVTAWNVASMQDNPNSIINQITQAGNSQIANTLNQNNAHGILNSGATAAAITNTQQQQARQTNDQFLNFQQGMNNQARDNINVWNTIYGDLAKQAGELGGGTTTGSATPATAQSPEDRATVQNNNNKATAALNNTAGVTALAKLYNDWKGSVDESVLRAIDQKLIAAREKAKVKK